MVSIFVVVAAFGRGLSEGNGLGRMNAGSCSAASALKSADLSVNEYDSGGMTHGKAHNASTTFSYAPSSS